MDEGTRVLDGASDIRHVRVGQLPIRSSRSIQDAGVQILNITLPDRGIFAGNITDDGTNTDNLELTVHMV